MSERQETQSPASLLMLIPSLLLFGILFSLAIPTALFSVLFVLPFNRKSKLMCKVGHFVTCTWCWITLLPFRIFGLFSLKTEGFEKLKGFNGVIISNHQSQLDIVTFLATYKSFRWVSKEALYKVPLLGWAMWSIGYIFLKRDEAASIRQMMDDCKRTVGDGFPVLIFPEGTRTTDGNLRSFKVGAFSIAKKLKCSIAIVTIEGSYTALPPKAILLRKLPRIRLTVREVLMPEDYASLKTKQFCADTEAKYREWLGE